MLETTVAVEEHVMRRTMSSRRALRAMLVANGCVSILTSAGALVVLLIAPLGLAAVLSCTLLVGLLSFGIGLAADVVLWRLWLAQGLGATLTDQTDTIKPGGLRTFLRRQTDRLPQRRP